MRRARRRSRSGDRRVTDSRGSSNSPRMTTAERASITSKTRGTSSRPTRPRSTPREIDEDPLAALGVDVRRRPAGRHRKPMSRAAAALSSRKAARPIGVIGRVEALREAETEVDAEVARCPRRVRRCGIGKSVVMGRAWVSQSGPAPSIAHSVSCGAP